MDIIWQIIAISFAFLTAISLVISIRYYASMLQQEKRLRTLEYATNQFDVLDKRGSREELRKTKQKTILDYINTIPEANKDSTVQMLMQYVYVFNRIGAGIYTKALNEKVIFEIWPPQWFIGHWSKWKSFVKAEREKRGEVASGSYVYFDWLANNKCPKVANKYPWYG